VRPPRTDLPLAIALVEELPALLRRERKRRGVSLRAAAAEAGVPFGNFVRAEHGENITRANVLALLRWLTTSEVLPCGLPRRPGIRVGGGA